MMLVSSIRIAVKTTSMFKGGIDAARATTRKIE
jgi:hypothetical protein